MGVGLKSQYILVIPQKWNKEADNVSSPTFFCEFWCKVAIIPNNIRILETLFWTLFIFQPQVSKIMINRL